ncbi:MAG: Omp28-related outer membrane protein [Bacteroidetes bacterium]|nr:Omp28-related outer membrane protein [Bacteroidota bacterium]
MKKILYTSMLMAALFICNSSFAQAKKYPLFEHFTQASCAPCADQNPFFQAVYYANESNMHHVAYHTSWPGVDEMYDFNPSESDEMVSYYGVSGVPDMIQNGKSVGSPTAVTQDVVNNLTTENSPIRILVSETTAGTTRNVHIEIQTVGTVPAGSYKLKAAVVEHLVEYISPPGSNGETEFPNVFRESITGTGGVTYTPAALGSSVTFDYSYELDPIYVDEQIYTLAWVQNASTKEVLNSGAAGDPQVEVYNIAPIVFTNGTAGSPETFTGNVENLGVSNANITITLTKSEPADWSSSFDYNGMNYTTTASSSINALSVLPIDLEVNVGTSAGIGEYTITVEFPDNPEIFPQVLTYFTISGVTDLIVNNEVNYGDGTPYDTYDFETLYVDALDAAGITTFASTSHFTMKKGFSGAALDGIENIYYNVAWTFPALVDDPLKIEQLEEFLDNGGNLFIAGQDIGWEVDNYAAYYPEAVSFYEDYLHASFVNDVASGATSFTAVATDEWYGAVAESNLAEAYGAVNYYPEQIEAMGIDATDIFTYNAGTKVGGVRSETSDYKTVYLGVGLEMIEDEAVRNAIMNATYLYFKGELNGIAFDNVIQNLLGSAYPNPAMDATTISFTNLDKDYTMNITDISGRIVMQVPISGGTTTYPLNVSELNSGMYFYYLTDGQLKTQTEKLNIIK